MEETYFLKKFSAFCKKFLPTAGFICFAIQIIISICKGNPQQWHYYPLLVLNCISFLACAWLFFHPEKFIIYGLISFLYMILYTFLDVDELVIILCEVTSFVSFDSQGFLRKHKNIKYSIVVLIFFIILGIRIYLFYDDYTNRLLKLWPFVFSLFIILFFFANSILFYRKNSGQKIINLNFYTELSDRQKQLIISILNYDKYETFARLNNVSVSTVKKDAVAIFRIFESFDRNAFVLKYSTFDFMQDGQLIYKGRD